MHEEDRERGKTNIGHFVLAIGAGPPVRQVRTAVAQRPDELFKVLHMVIDSEICRFGNPKKSLKSTKLELLLSSGALVSRVVYLIREVDERLAALSWRSECSSFGHRAQGTIGIKVNQDDQLISNAAGKLVCGALVALALTGCGMSSLTSGLSGGLFSKSTPAPVKSVTEEQLLSAAKAHNGTVTGSVSNVDVAHGCPRFQVWARDNAVTAYADGQVGDGLAVVHRGEITRTARECRIDPGRVTVKYGFSGRVLLGPKGQPGRVSLPVHVFVTDAKRERIAADKLVVEADVSLESPIGYFSQVRTVTFNIPQGTRPGEFEVFVGFEQNPAAATPARRGLPRG